MRVPVGSVHDSSYLALVGPNVIRSGTIRANDLPRDPCLSC